jgi:DNA-binding MarR family transcriptional regulator
MSSIMRKTVDHVNQTGMAVKVAASDDVLELMHGLMHLVRARHQAQLRGGAQDLTPLEGRVLGFFARQPGATQRELAEHSGRDKGQLARLINGLKERGLLEARADEADRRVTRLHLTEAARQQHQAALRLRRRLAEAATAGLSDTQRQTLLALLRQVAANLEAAS